METKNKYVKALLFIFLTVLSLLFLFPVFTVLINSFKQKFTISASPFSFPDRTSFAGLSNYINAVKNTGFIKAFFYSAFVTVFSVAVILICTSMTAWYIARVKSFLSSVFYKALLFSMIVPFQMVMFTLSKTANVMGLDNPVGLVFIYLGFGSGLSVFLFAGFIKSIPLSIEQAATIDGCSVPAVFFYVVLPLLKPMLVTVAILQTMWIWNDYLLPYLTVGSEYKTVPIAVQYLKGGYGSVDMGALMAVLVLSIIPVVIFYLTSQKYIIKGIAAGAVKG